MNRIENQQGKVMLRLFGTFLGGALILNSFLLGLFFQNYEEVSSFSAFLGALLLGTPIVYSGFISVMEGKLRMMELAALAIVASFALEKYQTTGIVAFFMLLAELLQTRTALGARAAIEDLIRLAPNDASLLNEGKEEKVFVHFLKKGDIVRIRPGENIPADGVVIKGQSAVRQAEITGESLPVEKNVDSEVFAGTNNLTGVLEVRVTNAGEDTTLGKVKQLILKAEESKTPIMKLIDQHMGWYTPTIVMLAGMILYFSGEIERAITALVVTCPSALILATPTALVASLSCAARLGILIKDVGYLEEAAHLNSIVFDKTGTLTTGTLEVTRLTPAVEVEASHLLTLAASAEQFSNHPAAKAIVKVAQKANLELAEPHEIKEIAGKGMLTFIHQKKIMVGRESWLREEGCDFSSLQEADLEEAANYSIICVSENSKCIGWIGLEDTTREEAKEATRQLKELGCHNITMLTGDRWSVSRRVAQELGCSEVYAECLPETKLQLVEKMKKNGFRMAVVGDGVNDAPALASGNIGIAMGAAGSDIAIHSASIALLNNNLNRLPFLIRLARKTRSIIQQNLIFGALFIVLGLTFSGLGWLNPIIAAFIHTLGAFIIIFNSARLVRFGEDIN